MARYAHCMPVGADCGLDYCYDCNSEVYILVKYLKKTKPELDEKQLTNLFCEMSQKCGFESMFHRTLMDLNPGEAEKTRNI